MKSTSFFKHLRDILILPFNIVFTVPLILIQNNSSFLSDDFYWKLIGIFIFLIGLSLFVWTIYLFDKIGKGTLAPWQPTSKLIVKGPYKHCRNPMITAVLLILTSEFLIANSLNVLIWTVVFYYMATLYFMFKEEPDLRQRFGSDYVKYKKYVPRWIPRLKANEPN